MKKFLMTVFSTCFNFLFDFGSKIKTKLNLSSTQGILICVFLIVWFFMVGVKTLITHFSVETLDVMLTLGIYRILFVILFGLFVSYLKTLPLVTFVMEFAEEQDKEFFEKTNSYIIFLRRWRTAILLLSLALLTISAYSFYITSNLGVSNILLGISVLLMIGYVLQSIIYVKTIRSVTPSMALTLKYPFLQKRGVWTKVAPLIKPTGEILSTMILIVSCTELGGKLGNGSINAIPRYRQALLNYHFPNDQTKIWDESKAFKAYYNRARGLPHDFPIVGGLLKELVEFFDDEPVSEETLRLVQDFVEKQKILNNAHGRAVLRESQGKT